MIDLFFSGLPGGQAVQGRGLLRGGRFQVGIIRLDKLAASQKGSAFDTLLRGKYYFAAPRHYHSHILFLCR